MTIRVQTDLVDMAYLRWKLHKVSLSASELDFQVASDWIYHTSHRCG